MGTVFSAALQGQERAPKGSAYGTGSPARAFTIVVSTAAAFALFAGIAAARTLTLHGPHLGLLTMGDGRVLFVDPDGPSARIAVHRGEMIAAIDGHPPLQESTSVEPTLLASGGYTTLTRGGPDRFILSLVPNGAESTTWLVGEIVALAAALSLLGSALLAGFGRDRSRSSRLYAVSASLLAIALSSTVARAEMTAWSGTLVLPATLLGLGSLWLALKGGAQKSAGRYPLTLAILLGFLPIALWPGVTIVATVAGLPLPSLPPLHISPLWSTCGLVPMAALFAAYARLGEPWMRRFETTARVATAYVLGAALIASVLALVLPLFSDAGRLAALILAPAFLPFLVGGLMRAFGREAVRRTASLQAAFAASLQEIDDVMTLDALATTLTRTVSSALGDSRIAVLIAQEQGGYHAYIGERGLVDKRLLEASDKSETIEEAARCHLGLVLPYSLTWDNARPALFGILSNRIGSPEEAVHLLARAVALQLRGADLTARALERTAALTGLTHRLADAHERERSRLSHELHDVVAQDLIALTRHLRRYGEDRTPPPAIWADMLTAAQDALAATRRICNGLRPAILDLGLVPALRDLLEDEEERWSDIDIRLIVEGEEQRLPTELEFALFRIAQEGLNNALHHAEAKSIRIEVLFDERARVRVRDDGCGFTVPPRFEDIPGDHLGLVGMRERLLDYRGTLTITSAPGSGTLLEATIPQQNNPDLRPGPST